MPRSESKAHSSGQVRPSPTGAGARRKIFFLVDSLNVGGTETQAVELARRLDPSKYEVTLGCLRAQGPLLERLQGSAVSVMEFHPKGGIDSVGGVYQLIRLAGFLRRGGFDIVHTHDLWSNLMGVLAARMACVPVIISSRRDLAHFDWYQTKRRVWLRRIQNLSHVVLTNANPIRDALIADDGFVPQKIRVIHNGVELEKFRRVSRDRIKLFPGVGESKLIVLVGNMHGDVKGHPWLIAAAPAVVKEFPQTRFVFAGDGEQKAEFERQAAALGLKENFLFLGRRSDIPDILGCCDIAVLPSKAEGLPNAVLEYLAAGLPTVVSSVGGNTEIIQDGVTGLIVPPQDSKTLGAALLRLLCDPELARRLAENGHEYVRQNFSFEKLISDVDALYTELLRRRQRPISVAQAPAKGRWDRLASMSPEELAVRLRQFATARFDWLRYKLGIDFYQEAWSRNLTGRPRFFFSPETVSAICSLLQQRFPTEAEQIVERAKRICHHHFDLLGYENVNYGEEIDWHCDRVHGKRAPRKPWFQSPYLDFAEVGDSKITWELNRHQHLVTLAKAYRLTGNENFATEIFRQWQHWQAENPYPIGLNWASSLEVAFRSLSWIWVYFLLEGSPAMPEGFRPKWLRALGVNGRHIECYLSTYFSPNTHLLGEGVALFFIGMLCPELRLAERWKRRGWQIVLREAQRQVQADGLHFEQSTYYHVYALDFFLHAGVLASINDIRVPLGFDRTLEGMLDALCVLSRAGAPPRLGDDDGGRVFDPRRNRMEHLLDPLATGAVLFGRGDFKSVVGGLREETMWLLGEQGMAEFDRLPAKVPMQGSTAFATGGLYVMAGADLKQQLVVDSGSQGALTAGHGHADALSLSLNCDGRALLVDPGTLEYAGKNSERDRFRGTSAHNTLQVDGVDQAEPNGPFAWKQLPRVNAEGWISGQSFDLFVGSHDGYFRLTQPVLHRRWVFALKSNFWLVRDVVVGEGKHQLDLFWHLSPELKERSGVFLDNGGRTGLHILAPDGHGWSREVRQGSCSPVYGRKENAPVLHFGTMAALPAEFVTLLVPVADHSAGAGNLTQMRSSSAADTVKGYGYVTPEEEHRMFFSLGKAWKLGVWSSDAEFLYWGKSRDGARQILICCNGTYVEAEGGRIVSSPKPLLRCEIISSDGRMDVVASAKDVVVNKEALQGASTEFEPVLTNSRPGSVRTRP
jgi:glycosyltransferase involved in cell wall biosynthesis